MAGNILESITAQYHSLTRSGKKLADYIFAHTGEAQYFSISTLAEKQRRLRSFHYPFLSWAGACGIQ